MRIETISYLVTRYGMLLIIIRNILKSGLINMFRTTIQQRPDFIDGSLDIDSLCTELRMKAKCSETGVVIDKKDVDAALSRLPAAGNSPNAS